MTELLASFGTFCARYLGLLILAVVVWLIGKWLIGKLLSLVEKLPSVKKLDETLVRFIINAVKAVLYVVLVITIISILGIPMASVITVLASAGVAVGMALQGSLSNLAGGIMLMIFRPFNVGDYINSAGGEGIVKEITLFYTKLTTLDNRTVTIPNGSLMNANVTNFSAEATRRVDLVFACAKGENVAKVQEIMLEVMNKNEMVLKDPEPFARISGGTNESMEFTVRAWCNTADYWTVYFDLTQAITEALGANGIKAPAFRVINN